MKTYEFCRKSGDVLGPVLGTVAGDHVGHAARKLCDTEAALWGSVWLRERGGKMWREFTIDSDAAFPAGSFGAARLREKAV